MSRAKDAATEVIDDLEEYEGFRVWWASQGPNQKAMIQRQLANTIQIQVNL